MRVALANDHGGYPLRKAVIEAIAATGNELVDLGADSIERSDYPDFGKKAGEAILSGESRPSRGDLRFRHWDLHCRK